jgi:precorrin-6Y C5,15-methyltransferase (decarboxylating)
LAKIIRAAIVFLKPDGLVVVNTVLIQNIQTASETLRALGFSVQMIQVQISRSRPMPWGDRLDAGNPVWIISGMRKSEFGKWKT